MKTAVLTDSSSDLDLTQAHTLGAHLLLLTLEFSGQDWLDHLELSSDEMFKRIAGGAALPTLKLPSANQYHKTIENLLRRHDHVFALHSSPHLGKVYDFAAALAPHYAGRLTVYNSGTTSSAMALQTERAVKLLSSGLHPHQVMQILRQIQGHQCSRICMTSTEGLRRGKLLNGTAAQLSTFLGTKPIFGVTEGKLVPATNERNQQVALDRMLSILREKSQQYASARIIYGHNGENTSTEILRQEGQKLGLREVMSLQMGAVLSSFSGPNAYSFTVEPERTWYQFHQY